MRNALIGIFIGVVIASAGFKIVEMRRTASAKPVVGDAAAVAASSRAELETAKATITELRRKNDELERRLQSAAAGAGSPATGGGRTAGGGGRTTPSWKPIAAQLVALKDKLKGREFGQWPAEAKMLELDLIAMVRSISADGLTLDETVRMPDGLPSLLIEALALADPPPTAEQQAQFARILEAARGKWKEFLDTRESLSAFEQRLRMPDLTDATWGALHAALTPAQAEFAKSLSLFDGGGDDDGGGPQKWVEGPREKVTQALMATWSESLKLEPFQAEGLRPVVEDYMKKFQAMQNGFWERRRKGEEVPRREEYEAQVRLMMETQRQISGVGQLTEAQAKALKEWSTVYGCNVHEQDGK